MTIASSGPPENDLSSPPSGVDARAEVQALREELARLQAAIAEAEVEREALRQARRAAINLMEDAVIARQAEQRQNAERQRVEEELRQANRRKDEFLAMLAHELRNPLAPIRTGLELLAVAENDSGVIQHVRQVLQRQVGALIRLVDDLLEVSRINCGKINMRKECVDLRSIVAAAVETSSPLIERAGLALQVELPTAPLNVYADPVRLSQVMSNLLNNAAQYTAAGGHIWLTAQAENEVAVVTVRDDGIGIEQDMLPKVFELFNQLDAPRPTRHGGLGIGLALVRQLVEAHGGVVEAVSQGKSHGSKFVVRLPMYQPEDIPTDVAPTLSAHLTPDKKVLIVDDNRDAANTLATLLKYLGASVAVANSGEHALEAIPSHRPTVAILDIGMPGMNGYELARRIRELPEGDDITLIALTGWGQEEDIRKSEAAGFNHHLVKPVDVRRLQSLLEVASA